jgi:hypothetical protein
MGFLGEDGRSTVPMSNILSLNQTSLVDSAEIDFTHTRINHHAGSRGSHVPASRRRPGVHPRKTPDILAA